MSEPPSDDQIWRYMDIPKFLAMLDRQALYFCRADLLGDKFEGSVTQATIDQREWLRHQPPPGMSQHGIETWAAHQHEPRIFLLKRVFINCWHMGAHESMAMWRGYGGGDFGLAVQSTRTALGQLFPKHIPTPQRPAVDVEPVTYGDYNARDEFVPGRALGAFLFKSNIYKHESELRALFMDLSFREGEEPAGVNVSVDLETLVHAVVISPLAPSWYEGVVRNTLQKLGWKFELKPSVHSADPRY